MELLVVKKDKDRLKFKAVKAVNRNWNPPRYMKVIKNKDFNQIAFLFYDLHQMGYPIDKAYGKFKSLFDEPELFFLKT